MGSHDGGLQNQITLPGFFPSPLPDKWPWRTNFSYLSERNALYLMLNKQYWVMAEHAVLPWTFKPHFSDQSFARVHMQKEPAWYGLDDVCIPSADAFDDCPNCKSKWAQSMQYWTRESSTCKKETRLDWASIQLRMPERCVSNCYCKDQKRIAVKINQSLNQFTQQKWSKIHMVYVWLSPIVLWDIKWIWRMKMQKALEISSWWIQYSDPWPIKKDVSLK